MNEVLKAQTLLREKYDVESEVWAAEQLSFTRPHGANEIFVDDCIECLNQQVFDVKRLCNVRN